MNENECAASTRCVASLEADKLLLSRFHVEDLPELFGSILQRHQHEGKLAEVMLESHRAFAAFCRQSAMRGMIKRSPSI
eukprot:scaffold26519_cov101-Isochrysis_galbana.AAC.4